MSDAFTDASQHLNRGAQLAATIIADADLRESINAINNRLPDGSTLMDVWDKPGRRCLAVHVQGPSPLHDLQYLIALDTVCECACFLRLSQRPNSGIADRRHGMATLNFMGWKDGQTEPIGFITVKANVPGGPSSSINIERSDVVRFFAQSDAFVSFHPSAVFSGERVVAHGLADAFPLAKHRVRFPHVVASTMIDN